MAYDAGTAWIQVLPSFDGVQAMFQKEAEKLGRQMDNALSKGTVQGMQKAGREAQKEGAKAGNSYADAFSAAVGKRVEAALKAIPEIEPDIKLGKFDRKLAEMREKLARVNGARVEAKVNDETFLASIRRMAAELRKLERDAPNISQFFNANAMRKELDEILGMAQTAREAGFRAGDRYGGAFAKNARASIDSALKNLPDVQLGLNPKPFDTELARIRAAMASIRGRIGVDLDDARALVELRKLEAELDAMIARTKDVTVKYNLEKARDQLKEFAEEVAPTQAKDAGERAGGAFQEAFSKRLTDATKKIPDLKIGADTTDVEVSIAAVRREVAELSGKTIGVDIDEGTALIELTDLKRRLDELARNDTSVKVRADAAAAAAELNEILILAGLVDRANPKVKVEADGAKSVSEALRTVINESGVGSSRLVALITIGASIGSIIAPAAAAAAVAISGIGTAAAAAASGLGVAILGFSGIGGALGALDKYQQDSVKSAASLTKSQNTVARSVDGVASAERSLENTRASAASAARRASQAVVDAKKGEVDAAKDVIAAQKGVIDAQKQAQRAQEDLTRAYRDARREAEDQVLALKDVALAQRQGALDVAEAKKKLDKLLANPRATADEREQAKITYEQRVLQLEELGVRQQRLTADKADADKKGVEGSDKVRSAQDKVSNATDGVAKAQDRVASAQEGVIKAHQRVADAIESQSDQQRQAAFQIEQGRAAVVNAMRAAENAATSAGVAGGAALENLKTAMDALGPAGQRFAKFLFGLKPVFLDLRNVAQAGLLPGVEAGIRRLLPYVTSFKDFIGRVATALSGIFQDAIAALEKPTWKAFFSYISDTAVPALEGMFEFTENIARGLVALMLALSPFNADMGKGLIGLSESFARWAESLSTSQGFQKFLAYVKENGPRVVDLIEQLGLFVIRFVIAAAPVGERVLRLFQGIFDQINQLPMGVLVGLIATLAVLASVVLTITVATKAYLTVAGLVKAVQAAWSKGTDLSSRAQRRFRGEVEATNTANRAFGFGLGNIDQQSTRAADSTDRLSRSINGLRSGLSAIGAAEQRGLSRVGDAVSIASRGVAAGAQTAGGAVSNAMQTALARYSTAITTTQGRVGLFAKAHEIAFNAVGATTSRMASVAAPAMARYTAAITTADGRVGLFAKTVEGVSGTVVRAHQAIGQAVGTQQARYATAMAIQSGAARAFARTHEAVSSTVSGGFSRIADLGTSAMSKVRGAFEGAATRVGGFGRAMTGLQGAGAKVKEGLGSLVGFLGGPWGAAITASVIGIGLLTDHMAKNKAKVEETAQSYIGLGKAIRQAREEGNKSAVADLVSDNKDLQELIRNADKYGLSADTVINALAGEKQAVDDVNASLDRQKASLEQVITEHTTFTASGLPIMDDTAKSAQKALTKLNAMRGGFHALVGDQTNAAKAGEIYNRSTESGAEDMGLFAASVNDMRAALTTVSPTSEQLGKALSGLGLITADVSDKAALYSQVSDKVATSNLDASEKADLYRKVLGGLGTATELHGPTFDGLAKTFSNIAQSELAASDKSALLKQSLDQLYGGVISQTEAAESLIRAQGSLATQLSGTTGDVKNSSAGFDLNTAASGKNRDAILGNRDALEAALQATRDKYVADLVQAQQAGDVKKAIAEATVEHQKSMETILGELPATQRQSAAVKEMVEQYGVVPPIVDTDVKATGLDKVIDDMVDAHAVQLGLAAKPPWEKFQIEAEARLLKLAIAGKQAGSWGVAKAEGGPIPGWSPHPKADNIPIWATAREFMQPVASVDHYGVGVMEMMRRRAVPRELFSPQMMRLAGMVGHANGGLIRGYARGGSVKWPIDITADVTMPVSLEDLWKQWESARNPAYGSAGPSGAGPGFLPWPSATPGSGGPAYDTGVWHNILDLVRGSGIPYSFGNSFRPGDPLWHGAGRAIDFSGYEQDRLAQFFMGMQGQILELIHTTSQGGYYITRGQRRRSMGIQDALHRNHLHVAMASGGLVPAVKPTLFDRGGFLQPGWNPPVYNGTGRPEPVLNQKQWGDISRLAGGDTGPGTVNNWHFRDTTLDPGKLRAIEDRQTALARVGRPR